jgi:hypothetical protein
MLNMNNYVIKNSNTIVKYIGNEKVIFIPKNITEIGNYAFAVTNSIEYIIIPDAVNKIGNYAFAECINLKSVIIFNNDINIGDNAFIGCTNLNFNIHKQILKN